MVEVEVRGQQRQRSDGDGIRRREKELGLCHQRYQARRVAFELHASWPLTSIMPTSFRGRLRGSSYRRRGRGNGDSGKRTIEYDTSEVDDESLYLDGENAHEAREEERANKRVRWGSMDENDPVKDEDASDCQSYEENVTQVVDIKV